MQELLKAITDVKDEFLACEEIKEELKIKEKGLHEKLDKVATHKRQAVANARARGRRQHRAAPSRRPLKIASHPAKRPEYGDYCTTLVHGLLTAALAMTAESVFL